ncbi:MAG: hypothetical protein IPL61_06965 [Myxococcales bacterium]|nr:hypothetical protein [Myxococcales bacterium]
MRRPARLHVLARREARVGRNGPDELTRLGHSVTHADGSGYGIGCASTAYVTYGRGVVYADGPLYLTRAACQDAIAAQQLHDARTTGAAVTAGDEVEADELTDGDEDADATWTTFALGGC